MEYKDFTSLPPEQERSFVVFEQTSVEAGKKALTVGVAVGAIIGVFALIIFFSFDAAENAHAVEAEPKSELAEEKKAPTKAAAPEPAAAEQEADEPAADESAEGAEEGSADQAAAPTPPKGATKAPPTALVGQ